MLCHLVDAKVNLAGEDIYTEIRSAELKPRIDEALIVAVVSFTQG